MTVGGERTDFDVIVIGGGTAGMTVATQIARAGRRVALIESDRTGGDCLYTGCVPSKSLIASARLAQSIRDAHAFGIDVGPPRIDLTRVMARKQRIIERIAVADSPETLERAGVTVLTGLARFLDPHVVSLDDRRLRADRLVIATGSRPAIPPIPGLVETGYLTNEGLMELRTLPARLAVIGAGPLGLELGQTFSRLGSQVTVIERGDRVLPRDDAEIAEIARAALEREGVTLHLGAEILRAERDGDGRRLTLRDAANAEHIIEADAILVATGRMPDVDDLGLEAAGVALDGHRVRVDKRLRTTASHIWACGDVIGPPYFTHVAEDQARTVAANVLGGRATWSVRAIPWATFTDPEVAGVGMTERAARERYGDELEVLRLPFEHVDRAVTDGVADGLIKLLLAPGWMRGQLGGEIVGAHVVGPRAGEVVQQFAFQITWRLPAGLLVKTVQTYPTYSLGGRQALGLHWRRRADAASPSRFSRLARRLDDLYQSNIRSREERSAVAQDNDR